MSSCSTASPSGSPTCCSRTAPSAAARRPRGLQLRQGPAAGRRGARRLGARRRGVDDLLAALAETGATLVAVSNEVGLGLVPEYPLARLYRDQLGWANQRLAAAADRVYFLVAGFPLDVKALAASPLTPVLP